MWADISLYVSDFLFAHNTYVSCQPFKHSLFREQRFWWTSPRWTAPLIFSFVATAACSGFLGNGQRSESGRLGEADNQLCGWRNTCSFEFGKWRLILGFDIPVSSFTGCCSFWSLRIILGNINQRQGGTNFSLLITSFILFPFFIFFLRELERVCTGSELQARLLVSVGRKAFCRGP